MSEYIEFSECNFDLEQIEAACKEDYKAEAKESEQTQEAPKEETVSEIKGKIPKFNIVAYTGVPMNVGCYGDPIIIELDGIKALNKKVPIRMNHNRECGVGHATKTFIENGSLKATVTISRKTEFARDVYESAINGFPWQISVGGKPLVAKHYEEGEQFVANGKTYKGPMTHVEQFELDEMSFCDLGADSRTSAAVSASRNLNESVDSVQEAEMADEKIEATVEEELVEAEAVEEKKDEPVVEEIEAASTESVEVPVISETVQASFVETKKPFDEEKNYNRIAAINSVPCNGYEELRAQAIEEGWSFKDYSTALKAARHSDNIVDARELPKVQAVKNTGIDAEVIEACIVEKYVGNDVAKKNYNEEILNKADDLGKKIQGFHDLFSVVTGSTVYRNDMHDSGYVQAAFTTTSLNKIFKNVLNKTLLAAYDKEGEMWRKICHVSSTNDFKPVYGYRVDGDFDYERIGEDGEIKNSSFSEEEYTNQVESWAKMFSITRKMIINDDLNALTAMVTGLGEGASKTINKKVFSLLLTNGNQSDGYAFFSTNHSNLVQSTSTFDATLDIASLSEADLKISSQLTPEGEPIIQDGKILLVPNSLKLKAWNLMNSIEVNETTTTNVPQPKLNPFAGKYEVISTPWLNTTSISGGSATDWYLFGDVNRISPIDVVFLNGKQQPTVEQSDAPFDRFGIQYRAYIDFGVKMQDWRGAVKVTV